MLDIIKKFFGKSIGYTNREIKEKDFVYMLIHLPVQSKIEINENYFSKIEKIFRIAEKTNGDINQFCCGTILLLYGLPVDDDNKYKNIKKMLKHLSDINGKINVIAAEDRGLYGSFGYEKRLEVTAISENLIKSHKEIINMPKNKIMVQKLLMEKIGYMENIEII